MFRRQMINSVRAMVRQCSDGMGSGGVASTGTRVDAIKTTERRGDKSVNEVTLIGRLARDLEMRDSTVSSGMPYMKIVVVTSKSWKTADGEFKNLAEFHSVFHFSGDMEYVNMMSDKFRSGDKVYVRGRLSYSQFEGGSKVAYIKASEMLHLSKSYKRMSEEFESGKQSF